MLVGDGMWVTVRYRLFDSQGVALEEGERELTYLQGGFGSVFPKIEEALVGHKTGYATSVYLQPEDGFGDYDADRV
ncbi:MAG: peptidylprolyl isomerase, partial [Burkholderiaceae bacterium]|nr:peptidylprolyl isomerase [Burkholderiaceae bacterium]